MLYPQLLTPTDTDTPDGPATRGRAAPQKTGSCQAPASWTAGTGGVAGPQSLTSVFRIK